jgi:hypothetical protein
MGVSNQIQRRETANALHLIRKAGLTNGLTYKKLDGRGLRSEVTELDANKETGS